MRNKSARLRREEIKVLRIAFSTENWKIASWSYSIPKSEGFLNGLELEYDRQHTSAAPKILVTNESLLSVENHSKLRGVEYFWKNKILIAAANS